MKRLADFTITFRFLLVIVFLLITILLSYCIKFIQMDNDFVNFLPKKDKDVVIFKQTGAEFGGNYMAMILFESDDVFSETSLSKIRELTKEYEKIDGVEKVTSLTNILDIKKIDGGIEVGKLVNRKKIPSKLKELQTLRNYTLSKEMYTDGIVSKDGEVTTVICRFKSTAQKDIVAEEIVLLTSRLLGEKHTAYYAGFPMTMYFTNLYVMQDMKKLIPIVVVFIMLILFISFRSFFGVILPFIAVGTSTLIAIGLMGVLGFPLTMISAIMPVILISCGSAYGIHMINKYRAEVEAGKVGKEAIKDTIKVVGIPILLSGLTTFIGFLALMSSNLTLFQDFGLFTAIGILVALFCAILIIPALLVIFKIKISKPKEIKTRSIDLFLKKLAMVVIKYNKSIAISALILFVICLGLATGISTEVNMLAYFQKDSSIRIAERKMQKHFGGSTPVAIWAKGDIKNPHVLKELVRLEKRMKLIDYLHHPQGIADLIIEMNDVMNDRRSIPETKAGVGNLWIFIEGNDILPQMLNSQNTESYIQAVIDRIDTKIISSVVTSVNDLIDKTVKKDMVVVEMQASEGIVRDTLINLKVAEIISDLNLDLEYKDLKIKDDSSLKINLNNFLRNDFLPSELLRQNTTDALRSYFKGDLAEIEINSDKIIQQISKMVAAIDKPTTNRVRQVLAKVLSKSGLYDEEDLTYAALSIMSLINRTKSETLTMALFKMVQAQVSNPSVLNDDKTLKSNIVGDLWAVNDSFHVMKYASYQSLTNKEIPGEQRVKLDVQQTGMGQILNNTNNQLLSSQIKSFGFAILLVLFVLMIQFRSVSGSFLAIIPILFTVAINFGIMRIFNIPLDNATMMIASIAIGIGIDYTIHISSRFKLEYKKLKDFNAAFVEVVQTTGRAIIINAVAVSLGFIVLILSSMEPLQRFGYLSFLTMIVSAVGAITIFPAFILMTKAKFLQSK